MLTVELVAAIGVMAGAQPEDMPLLLATVEAFKHPDMSWRGTSTTTAATNPIIISGPIVEKRGLNCGTGTAGPENPTTNALGYFINLVGDVVGGSVPPDMDKSTHGTAADFVAFVYCENTKQTPWKTTLAEDQGFSREDSVVTVMIAYPGGANMDHWSTTGPQLLDTVAFGATGAASGIGMCLEESTGKPQDNFGAVPYVLLVLGPEHAELIASLSSWKNRLSGSTCSRIQPGRTMHIRLPCARSPKTVRPMSEIPWCPDSRGRNPFSF